MKDCRFYAITRHGRMRLRVASAEEAMEEIRARPYFASYPPTRLVVETREEIDL